jgi:acetoin utilization deacetylase AcuC-like enzyme
VNYFDFFLRNFEILIEDHDVHHENGTNKMFLNDSQILFFSAHRCVKYMVLFTG